MTKEAPPIINLSIKELHHVAEFIEQCATWNYQEWGESFGFTYKSSLERIRQDAFSLYGEAAVIAFWKGTPAGMGFLERTGANEYPELTPWISGVYVEPEFRGKGIARELMNVLEDLAYDAGNTEVHLHTSTAKSLYEKLGWHAIASYEHKETGLHTVMRKALI